MGDPEQTTCVTFQVRDILQPLYGLSTTAISVDPRRIDVIMFGGTPMRIRDQTKPVQLGETTVLTFSEWCGACNIFVNEGGEHTFSRNEPDNSNSSY